MILAYSWGKQERRFRSTSPPINLSSKWGEHIGSRSWDSFVVFLALPLIFLHSLSCFGGIWEWIALSISRVLAIALGASVWVLHGDSWRWSLRSSLLFVVLVASWVACNPRRPLWVPELYLVAKLRDIVGRLQLIVEFPDLCVPAWSTPSRWPHSEWAKPPRVKLTENRVSTSVLLERLGGSTLLQRRRTSLGKELRETSPCLHFAVISILYLLLPLRYLPCLYHIGCYHLVHI